VAGVSGLSYERAGGRLDGHTARSQGEITAISGDTVSVRWTPPSSDLRILLVPLEITPPAVGTATEVAYDPAHPDRAIIPGAIVLADADRATGGLVFAALISVGVLAIAAWRLLTRARLRHRPGREVLLRRVRFQRGLITRSWLETETGPPRWIPVYFDPILVTLPAPTPAHLHGNRLVAVTIGDTLLYPSGRTRTTEPRGRRIDNPTTPDATAAVRAATATTLRRQLRVDAAAILPTPAVGLLWAFTDSSGFPGFLGATTLSAAMALWLWSLRGSDPS
jgi:hypothetical protein